LRGDFGFLDEIGEDPERRNQQPDENRRLVASAESKVERKGESECAGGKDPSFAVLHKKGVVWKSWVWEARLHLLP
jgi:hypothetical protein